MDFVNRLRMNNIFPEGGNNPLQAPANPPFNLDEMSAILDRVVPIAKQAKQDEWNHQQHLIDQERGDQQQQSAQHFAMARDAVDAAKNVGVLDPGGFGFGGGFTPTGVNGGGVGGRSSAPRIDNSVITPYQRGMLENANERNDINRELGRGRIGVSKENADVGKDRLNQNTGLGYAKLGVSQQNADTSNFQAHNPGLKVENPLGGNYQAFDPITGAVTDTGVSTGTMTQEGLQNKKGSQAIEQIGARIAGDKDVETQRQEGRVSLKGTPEAKPQTAADAQIGQFNRARQAVTEHPEWAPYIQFDRNGRSFNVSVPEDTGNFITGVTKGGNLGDLSSINKYIYGPTSGGAFDDKPAPPAQQTFTHPKYGKVTVTP